VRGQLEVWRTRVQETKGVQDMGELEWKVFRPKKLLPELATYKWAAPVWFWGEFPRNMMTPKKVLVWHIS
jgi:hypothetical protein